MHHPKAIIVGAGIAGLSLACLLEQKGFNVDILEKDAYPTGASIRNFGMIWPIGQPEGEAYNLAMRSRELWIDIAYRAHIPLLQTGSLHLAYHLPEWELLQEVVGIFQEQGRQVELLQTQDILQTYPMVQTEHLCGGMRSHEECIVNPREAITGLIDYLNEKPLVDFHWNTPVCWVEPGKVYTRNSLFAADVIFLATGADMHQLFPQLVSSQPLIKCKLQMLSLKDGLSDERLGIPVCGGLSLLHYRSFQAASSWNRLKNFLEQKKPEYMQHGIHVMVAQMPSGNYIVGDSHEYGNHMDPFERMDVNILILKELYRMLLPARRWQITETWHGIYLKMTNDSFYWQEEIMPGTFVYNGLGGAGMTLSFGLAEKLIQSIC